MIPSYLGKRKKLYLLPLNKHEEINVIRTKCPFCDHVSLGVGRELNWVLKNQLRGERITYTKTCLISLWTYTATNQSLAVMSNVTLAKHVQPKYSHHDLNLVMVHRNNNTMCNVKIQSFCKPVDLFKPCVLYVRT